jgi:two-component system response regulator QseB
LAPVRMIRRLGKSLDVGTVLGAPRILVVEDDLDLRALLKRILTQEAYEVVAVDGQIGMRRSVTDQFDVMVIDRGLPRIDGLEIISRIRGHGISTPVMMLTAYASVAECVAGLDAGADDCLVKPFEIRELLARIRALRRRGSPENELAGMGAGLIDFTSRRAHLPDGTEIDLSGRECALLRALTASPGRVFTREELRLQVFDNADSASIVDTYVHYLRRKLGRGVVLTTRGHGYRVGTLCGQDGRGTPLRLRRVENGLQGRGKRS